MARSRLRKGGAQEDQDGDGADQQRQQAGQDAVLEDVVQAVVGCGRMYLAAQPAHGGLFANADPGHDHRTAGLGFDAAGLAPLVRQGNGGVAVRLRGQGRGVGGALHAGQRVALPVGDGEAQDGRVAGDLPQVLGDATAVVAGDVGLKHGRQVPGQLVGVRALETFDVVGLVEAGVEGVGGDGQGQQQGEQQGELLAEGVEPRAVCQATEEADHSSSS